MSTQTEEPPTEPGEPPERPVCPHCMASVGELEHFCHACGGPVTAHAAIDPLGQVYTAGHAYRTAVDGRPKLITLIGIWLIFGPQVPLLLLTMVGLGRVFIVGQTVLDAGRMSKPLTSLGGFIVTGLLAFLYVAIIWKTTRRYRRFPAHKYGDCSHCGYNLRGSVDADRERCPECGEPITEFDRLSASDATEQEPHR